MQVLFGSVLGLTVGMEGLNGRELSADRPDSTESPITVEAGRFQLESSFFSFTRDAEGGEVSESWVIGETNLKLGLNERTDVQLVLAPFVTERLETSMGTTTLEGFGDPEVRLKVNLWGNDGGATAAGLLPWVKIPTGSEVSNDEWEGGLIVPFAWDFAEGWGLGAQVEVGRAWDETIGHYTAFSHTVVLGREVTEELGVFIEYVGTASEMPYEALFSAGVTFQVNDDLQFDVGGLVGLTDSADDWTLFSGVTARF